MLHHAHKVFVPSFRVPKPFHFRALASHSHSSYRFDSIKLEKFLILCFALAYACSSIDYHTLFQESQPSWIVSLTFMHDRCRFHFASSPMHDRCFFHDGVSLCSHAHLHFHTSLTFTIILHRCMLCFRSRSFVLLCFRAVCLTSSP